MAVMVQTRIETARTKQQTFFAELAAKYGFPEGPLTFDDATCSLVAVPTMAGADVGTRTPAPSVPPGRGVSEAGSESPPASPGANSADQDRMPAR